VPTVLVVKRPLRTGTARAAREALSSPAAPAETVSGASGFELWEAMTLIAVGYVADDVWERAAAVFGEAELAQLAFAIAVTKPGTG